MSSHAPLRPKEPLDIDFDAPAGRGDGAPSPIDVYVGTRIRLFRVMRGLSQEKLAQKVGVTFQQLQKYEHGKNRVSASRLVFIAHHLKVMPAALLPDTPNAALSDSGSGIDRDRETLEMCRDYNDLPDIHRHHVRRLIRAIKNELSEKPSQEEACDHV